MGNKLKHPEDVRGIKRRLDVRPSKQCSNCSNKEIDTNAIGEPELICQVSHRMNFVTLSGDVCDLWNTSEDE